MEFGSCLRYVVHHIINLDGSKCANVHSLSVGIKPQDVTIDDLLIFAKENDILKSESVMDEVRQALLRWKSFTEESRVSERWVSRISEALEGFVC